MAEYNGIVAGIGDKENGINLIKPEYDAALNYYILGKSKAVITGLNIEGTTLKKGVCALCGYVGTLETDIQNITGYSYIYGRFTLNFGNGLDQFDIVALTFNPAFDNVNPTSITEAGVYYIYLYYINNGVPIAQFDTTHNYPEQANSSANSDLVNTTVEESVVGTTQPVNSHTNYPTRIATCEYVHNQIGEEIDYQTGTYDITVSSLGGTPHKIGELKLKKKAKYCIGTISFTFSNVAPADLDPDFNPVYNWGQIDQKFYPKTQSAVLVKLISLATAVNVEKTILLLINTNGSFVIDTFTYNGSGTGNKWGAPITYIGWETN